MNMEEFSMFRSALLVVAFAWTSAFAFASPVDREYGWSVIEGIRWARGYEIEGQVILKEGFWARDGVFALSSEDGTWVELVVNIDTEDREVSLYVGETKNGKEYTSKVMPASSCKRASSGMQCKLHGFIGGGSKKVLFRITNFDGRPIRLLGIEARRWEGKLNQNSGNARNLDLALSWMRENYWKSSDVNWETLSIEAHKALASPFKEDPTAWAINSILTLLPEYAHSGVARKQAAGGVESIYSEQLPTCSSPGGNMVVLSLPKTASNESAYIEAAHKCTRSLNSEKTLVVDVREQGGGSAHVLFASLYPVLGDRDLVRFINGSGENFLLSIRNGGVYTQGVLQLSFKHVQRVSAKDVAMVIGGGCGSACETLAIAVKGIWTLYGEPTAGLTSANEVYELPEGYLLFLTAGATATLNGTVVSGSIAPDIEMDLKTTSDDLVGAMEKLGKKVN